MRQETIPSLEELQRSMTRSKSESDIVIADRGSSLQMSGEELRAVSCDFGREKPNMHA
jgi:hypothetical protein